MKNSLALSAAVISVVISACASQPQPAEALRPGAVQAAQQRGAAELACPAATAQVLSEDTIPEPQGTGWYEPPHRAEYTVSVSGCGKHATYSVGCDDRQKGCTAGPLQTAAPAPRQLADEMQPQAVTVAQQRGAAELACPAATTEVLRAETIEESQTTGWYEPPRHAAYNIAVSGCGKRTSYLIACDDQKKACVASTLRKTEEGAPAQLADQLLPEAVKIAQRQGAAELGCQAATTEVLRQETLEEPQTTGWYEPPHRAVYNIAVSGCGKQTAIAVACDDRKNRCVTGAVQRQ